MKITRLERLRESLGLERNVIVMTISGSIRGFGSQLWAGFLAKALESLGASGWQIGAFGTIGGLVSTGSSFIGGSVSDRLGRGRALIAAGLMALAGYAFYAAAPVWWLLIPGCLLLSTSAQFEFMGSLALVGEVVRPDRRAASMAAQRLLSYLPALVSPPLGGLLIGRLGTVPGFRLGVTVTILLTLVSLWLQRSRFRLPRPAARTLSLDLASTWRAMPTDMRRLLLANGLVFFGSTMSSLFVVLQVMDSRGISAGQFGLLQALEITILLVLIVPIGKLADSAGRRGRRLFVAGSFFFNSLFSLSLGLVRSPGWLIATFLLPGLRESFEPVRKALIIDLAGKGEHGRLIGLYYLLIGAFTFPASIIAGWLWEWNHDAPFLCGGAVSFAGLVVYLVTIGRDAMTSPRRREAGRAARTR